MTGSGGAGYRTKVLLVPKEVSSTMLDSPMKDATLTSIREPQSVARLIRTFSRSLSAVDLAESLASLDENQPVALGAELMRARNISVIGVRRAGLVAGWVVENDLTNGTLGENAREFRREEVIDESASLDVVLGALAAAEQVFIEWRGEVVAMITRRDLQKLSRQMRTRRGLSPYAETPDAE